jgi:ABC-type branched-subunit amino acid transport system substrate-binding protein
VACDRRAALIAAGLLACLAQPANALTEAQQRGKQIYFEGTSPRGALINAVVGDEASIIPAAAIPCANCHGYDGLGRPEGGVIPTDVRWSQLIKTYGHVHEDGRRHPAFDEESLTRSIIAGVDPANNRLDTSMPLYLLSGDDAADLVAYLKVLEQDFDPGVEEDRVRVATMLPREGRTAPLGDAMEKVLRAHFADVNERGGVFGRRIELVTVPLGATPEASLENLEQAMDTNGVFALVGGYTIGLDDPLLELIRYDNVPLVGPFTLDPGDALLNSAAFYLYPGFKEQVRVLADQAFGHAGTADKMLIANPGSGRHDDLVRTAEHQLRRLGAGEPAVVSYVSGAGDAAALAERVRSQGAKSLLFLGAQPDLDALLVEMAATDLAPNVYVLSSFLSKPMFDAPANFDQRVIVAYPTLASDISPKGREDYQDLARRHELPTGHIQAQVASFAAARLFVEGLQRAGRDLDRIRLAESIEELYKWETGVTPPLTYGPNLRIGASGAHLMILDLVNETMRPVGDGWHDVR